MLRPLGLLPLLLALGGCGFETLLFGGPSVEPPPEPLPPPRGDSNAKIDLEAGLAPLPSRQQVLGSVSFGRSDPFGATAPPAGAMPPATAPAPSNATSSSNGGTPSGTQGTATTAASTAAAPAPASTQAQSAPAPQGRAKPSRRPAPLRPPEGFRLTGVIRSGGQAEALVSFGTSSGSLRPGERGGRNTALLPAGWSLASIQFGGKSMADAPSITLLKAGQRVKVSLGGTDRLQIHS